MEETTHRVLGISCGESWVIDGCSSNGNSELEKMSQSCGNEIQRTYHLSEAKRKHQSNEDVDENLGSARVDGLIAGVISGIRAPTSRESENGCRE